MSTEEEVALVSEDKILAFTHAKRMFIVEQMLASGKLPEDPAEKKVLLNALDGMDKAALGRKRIKVEEKTNTSMAQAAALIAHVLNAPGVNQAYKASAPVQREAPTLPSDVPPPVLVEGETSVVQNSRNYETFMADMGKQEENA